MRIRVRCASGHALVAGQALRGKDVACPKCGAITKIPSEGPRRLRMPAAEKLGAHGIDLAEYSPPKPEEGSEAEQTWYVGLPSREQLGPIAFGQLSGWLAAGELRGDALVWRPGWPAWKPASAVFPELCVLHGSPSARAEFNAIDEINLVALDRDRSSGSKKRKAGGELPLVEEKHPKSRDYLRRVRRERALWATAILVVVAAGLLAILVSVVRRHSPDSAFRADSAWRMIHQVACTA